MKKLLMFILITTVFLCGCHANGGNTDDDKKKEQYAIIQNYEDGTDVTITPDCESYDEVVRKFTYAAMEEKQIDIPEEAMRLKSIVFYQAPTKTVLSSDKADSMKPFIEIDIYAAEDTQYAIGYLSSLNNIQFSFEMPEDLLELVETLGKSYTFQEKESSI